MQQEKERQNSTEQEQLKENIIRQLQELDNPLIFRRVNTVLNEKATLDQIQHLPAIQQLIEEEQQEDYQVRTRQSFEKDTALSRYDARTAQPMFYLALLSLLLIGALITAFTEEELSPLFARLFPWILSLTGIVYLFFAIDVALLFYTSRRHNERMNTPEKRIRLLTLLLPPLRIGSRDSTTGKYIWVPHWHWCKVNEGLLVELKRRFVLPMIGIALLIVPVLIIEWKFLEEIHEQAPDLKIELILNSVQTFIWATFTFEFILMISVSDRKLHYVKKNWLDLLIILLPFVSFLRTFRISQIARLKYATRSFKLRGVMTKARQGLIFIDFLQRIFRLRPENEVKRLYRLLRENQRDRDELQEKLKEVAQLIEKRKKRNKPKNEAE